MEHFLNIDSSAYKKWVDDSVAVYQKFAGQMYLGSRVGMEPDPFVTERKGGYYLFRRVSPEVAHVVERIGQEIKSIAPEVVVYPADALHTTYTDFRVKSGFVPSTAPDHDQVLDAFGVIARGLWNLSNLRLSRPCATYGEVLFGLNAFVLEGFSSDSSLLADALFMQEEGKKLLETELRLPWGAHVSFGRVAEPIGAAKARELSKYCRSLYPLMGSRKYPYTAIEAGWYTVSPEDGFQAHITSSFLF